MLLQMMALGAQQGICALVGKQIGLQDIETARRYQSSGYLLGTALVLACAVVLYAYLPSLVGILIPSQPVVDIIANDPRLRLVVAFSFVPDALKQVQIGIIKALGLQSKAIKFSFTGNWILNLALIYHLCFTTNKWGLLGIWSAKLVTEIFILGANTFLIESSDWEKIALTLQEKRNEAFEK